MTHVIGTAKICLRNSFDFNNIYKITIVGFGSNKHFICIIRLWIVDTNIFASSIVISVQARLHSTPNLMAEESPP